MELKASGAKGKREKGLGLWGLMATGAKGHELPLGLMAMGAKGHELPWGLKATGAKGHGG